MVCTRAYTYIAHANAVYRVIGGLKLYTGKTYVAVLTQDGRAARRFKGLTQRA